MMLDTEQWKRIPMEHLDGLSTAGGEAADGEGGTGGEAGAGDAGAAAAAVVAAEPAEVEFGGWLVVGNPFNDAATAAVAIQVSALHHTLLSTHYYPRTNSGYPGGAGGGWVEQQ
jgi:hypothetical protein